MPLRLDIKRKLSARSDRVKAVDFHPSEPWVMTCLYNGNVYIWNYENQTMVKTFEVTELPVRAGKFIARKNWVVTGSDDMQLRVFNYNTHEKVAAFEAHSDYIRSIAIHPTQPFVLTSSDDMLIKLWDWDRGWKNIQVFEGHNHYVMQITINPKDTNTFASASLDRTIKVWSLNSVTCNYTLEGHDKGVNCLDYYPGGEKPYLVSGADDKLVKVWDYQNKTCVQTLESHTQNVSVVCFHPELPIIVSGSEDGTVRIWHANTYRLENTLNYGMERVWALGVIRGSNDVAIAYDEGTVVIKLGREEPAVSMESSGKIVWARHNEIQTANANVRSGAEDETPQDGEKLALPVKELGSCEVYPQLLQHNPNGRFVVVCGDGEYIIYTALAWRNKMFGQALEFVWGADANEYAIRETTAKVKIFKNFKEKKAVKLNFSAEGIFGGMLLGVRAGSFLCFYDWENGALIRRVDVAAKNVYWSEGGEMFAITCEGAFYVLRYNREAAEAKLGKVGEDEGIEEAFDVVSEISETVKTACWVGDCFIYTNSANRLNYYVGGQINTAAHFDKNLYLLGYLPSHNRLYLVDKDLSVVSYYLPVSVLEYQTAILREDFETAERILPKIPADQRSKIARFLETQELLEAALDVSTDPEHRFELAISLKKLDIAYEIAAQVEQPQKWRQLSDLAFRDWKLDLAVECLQKADDLSGILLVHTAKSDAAALLKLAAAAVAAGQRNVAFVAYHLLGRTDKCIEILTAMNRLPEATFFARTYAPSAVSELVKLWRADLAKTNRKAAAALADPAEYPNLFEEDFELALEAEILQAQERETPLSSTAWPEHRDHLQRDPLEEARAEENGGDGDGDEEGASGQLQAGTPTSGKAPSPGTPAGTPSRPSGRKNSIGSSSVSMEVETAGTNSRRGDDDDLLSLGPNEADGTGGTGTVNDEEDEDLDDLLNA